VLDDGVVIGAGRAGGVTPVPPSPTGSDRLSLVPAEGRRQVAQEMLRLPLGSLSKNSNSPSVTAAASGAPPSR